MRFNIGDKVRVLDGSSIDDYYRGWTPGMGKYVGNVSRVEGIDGRGYTLSCDSDRLARYTWDERGLEKVDEKEPRFKVGDRVKILDGSGIPHYIGEWASSMSKYVGREATIARVTPRETGYAYSLEGSIFAWDERGLEKVDEIKPRFKVGDPVRVINGEGVESNSLSWMNGMKELIGRDVRIKEVTSICVNGRTAFTYRVTNDPSMLGWYLDENWLVPASDDHSPLCALKESREDVCDKSDKREEFCIGDRVRVKRVSTMFDFDKTKAPYVGAVGCIDRKGEFLYKVNGLPSSWHPDELEKVDPRTLTPKYKVGDRVMVLDGRDDKESHVYWVDGDGMSKCIGRVCTIQEVHAHTTYVSYRFADKVSPWCFDERWLVPADQARPTDDKVPSDPKDEPATIHFLPFERG